MLFPSDVISYKEIVSSIEPIKLGKKTTKFTCEDAEIKNSQTTVDFFRNMIKIGLLDAYQTVIKNAKSIVTEILLVEGKSRIIINLHITESLKTYNIVLRYISTRISEFKFSALPKIRVEPEFLVPPKLRIQLDNFKGYLNYELKKIKIKLGDVRPYLIHSMNMKEVDSSYIIKMILSIKSNLEALAIMYDNSVVENRFTICDGDILLLCDISKYDNVTTLGILKLTTTKNKFYEYEKFYCFSAPTSYNEIVNLVGVNDE